MRTIIICYAFHHPAHPAPRRVRHHRRDPRQRSPAPAPARAGFPQRQADRADPQGEFLRPVAGAHRHPRHPAAAPRGRQNHGVQGMKRIALLGMPNTGKSTLFNRITGGAARVGNWPGITVELLSGKILLGGDMVEIIDLHGIYDLHGFSDDEQVVRHFLHDNVPDLALVIINATQIERQMSLLLQLKQLNMNVVVLLNMADEAKKYGITIDSKKMSELLEMPIFLLSGKYGTGYPEAMQAITKALRYPTPGMAEQLRSQLEQDEHIEAEMARVMKHAVQIPAQLPENLTEKLDHVMLHPWLGLPLFFFIMYMLFQGVFLLGQPLQIGVAELLTWLRESALEPALSGLPAMLNGLLLDGVYNGVATVAAFVPIIILFFL